MEPQGVMLDHSSQKKETSAAAVFQISFGACFCWQCGPHGSQKALQWREKVIEVVVRGPMWTCANCQNEFEEGKHGKFEKADKPFCSMSCISKFR